MMPITIGLIFWLLVHMQPSFVVETKTAQLPLVPYPREVRPGGGMLHIGNRLYLVNGSDDPAIVEDLHTIARDLRAIGFETLIAEPGQDLLPGCIVRWSIPSTFRPELGQEGYQITVNKAIQIESNTPTGLFWASRTLLQLFRQGPGTAIAHLTIEDEPAHAYRGIMIDAARNWHPIGFHLEMIRRMSAFKLNQYMIHFSDNQSYTLPSQLYPSLPTEGLHYSFEEIGALIETAKKYHVNVVPSIDVPGHASALVSGMPALRFGPNPKAINIANEDTYDILQSLFNELLPFFPGEYWHLGADEIVFPDRVDAPNAAYKAWMKSHDLRTGGQLLNYFINRMHGFLDAQGKKVLVWEGFDPDLAPRVHRDVIVCPFDVKHAGKMPGDYIEAGHRLLNTSWSPLYIADKIYMTTPEIIARWTPFMFGAGRSPQPFKYWVKLSPEAVRTEIIGAQMCSWANEAEAEWGLFFGDMPGLPDYGRPGPRAQVFSERIWIGRDAGTQDLLKRTGAAYW